MYYVGYNPRERETGRERESIVCGHYVLCLCIPNPATMPSHRPIAPSMVIVAHIGLANANENQWAGGRSNSNNDKKKEKKKKQKAERETSNKYAKAKGGGDPNWVSVSGDARCVALGFVFGIQLINATRERSGVDRV